MLYEEKKKHSGTMKISLLFVIVLLNLFIGITPNDNINYNRRKCLIKHSSIESYQDQMKIEDVQLTEYKDGLVIKFKQQNFQRIREELLKEGALFEDDQFIIESTVDGQTIELKRPKDLIKKPVLIDESNTYFQMGQGILGNCWFVSTLMSLYEQKDLFHFIVPNDQSFRPEEYAGIFHFRFWQVGKWVDVVVDDRLPTLNNKLIYLQSNYSNEFWPSLIEKAYAKLISRSYKAFFKGSRGAISMQDLVGGISETYDLFADRTVLIGNKLFDIINNAKTKNRIVTCSTHNETTTTKEIKEEMKAQGIFLAHTYAITHSKIINVNSVSTHYLIRIRNPHGVEAIETFIGHLKNDPTITSSLPESRVDGESWILLEDFRKFFANLDICNLTPNNINPDIFTDDRTTKLSLTTVEGRWLGGLYDDYVSNNAEILDTNPQYRMTLRQHPDENKKYSILIGLSMKHREDLKLVTDSSIGITILNFNDDTNLPKPLNSNCKMCMEQMMKTKRIRFNGGQVGYRLELSPGEYYVIPLISHTLKRATYFLQILSEEKDILEVYDRDVNVPKMKDQFEKIFDTVVSDKRNRKVYNKFRNRHTKTADFKALYSILKNPRVSTNKLCKHPIQLDGISLNLQKLFSSKNYGSRKRLSVTTIDNIFSTSTEIYEKYQIPNKPGFISYSFMKKAFSSSGYVISDELLQVIFSKYKKTDNMIYLKDFIKIIITIKSEVGANQLDISHGFCQNLISMIPNHKPKEIRQNKLTGKQEILRYPSIDINQFETIIQFIQNLRNIFIKYDVSTMGFVPYTRMKRMLDEFGYELPYNIIEILVDTYRDESRIYYDKFIQCFVHMSLIFGKIEKKLSEYNLQEFNVYFDNLLHKFWLKMESRNLYKTLSLEEAIASFSDDIQKQIFQRKLTYYHSHLYLY